MSYEECSLFDTSTTQTPILSRIESLAVHINTFQAQIKKCKQNKKIYIYIIFSPIQRFQVSMQQILLNTESEEHTVQTVGTNRSLQRLLPFKHMGWGSWMAWKGKRRQGKGRREEDEQKGNRYVLGKMGQLGHTHGELVDFIYWFWQFSFWFLNPPPGPTMVEKPHRGG